MQLTRKGHLVMATKLAALGVTYAFLLLLTRAMPTEEFGQVATFLTLGFVLSVAGARGQQLALLRFLPRLPGDQHGAFVRQAAARTAATTAAVTCAAAVTLFGLAAVGPLGHFTPATILAGLLLVPAIGAADFVGHIARAKGQFQRSILPKELLWRLLTMICIGLVLWRWPGRELTAAEVMALMAAILSALAFAFGWRVFSGRARSPDPVEPNTTRAFWVTSTSNIMLANFDVAVVGLLVGPTEAGFYFVANRIAGLLGYFMVSQNVVVAPALAAAAHSEKAAISQNAARAMTVPTVLLGAALLIWSAPVLSIFGPAYTDAAPCLAWLVMAAIVNAATGPSDIALNMSGREKAAMRVALVSLCAASALLVTGALAYGAVGTAIAVAIATLLRKGLYWRAARRELGIRTDALAHLGRAEARQGDPA